jgi:transposase
MERNPLLPLPDGMLIEQIQITEAGVLISVVATHPTSCCPLCSSLSSSIHSIYSRTLQDVPCAGRQIQLLLTVRKFFCHNPVCSRKIFTERVPQFVKPWARMTIRLVLALQSIGLATSGKAGKRLAERLSIQTSRQTVLRRIMDLAPRPRGSILYLGLDDFSFRRGHRYGTICVDLESHRVIDVLPDRRAETVVQWMRQHPDITVVSRDRGGEYASAARDAAPQAIQIADRFHLYRNLVEAVELLLARCRAEIRKNAKAKAQEEHKSEALTPLLYEHAEVIAIENWKPEPEMCDERARLARRAQRYDRYQQVRTLYEQGLGFDFDCSPGGEKQANYRTVDQGGGVP